MAEVDEAISLVWLGSLLVVAGSCEVLEGCELESNWKLDVLAG